MARSAHDIPIIPDVFDIKDQRHALIIGDSFIAGSGARDCFGWAQSVAEDLDADIIGKCGATSTDLLVNLPNKPYQRVIVQIGVNDARFRHQKNGPENTLDDFQIGLGKLVAYFRARSSDVRFCFVSPLFVDEHFSVLYKPDRSYFNADLNRISEKLRDFCIAGEHQFISLSVISQTAEQLSDGLHPSDDCHRQIAKLVKAAL